MKTKIFVCSNSGIDYISHSSNIKSIPVILKFSEEEQYEDYVDVNIEAFYNRLYMDKKCKVTPIFQTYTKISEAIKKARMDDYERVLFILPSNEFSNLYIPVSLAISENKDMECYIYNSNTCCYPVAYMAIEADKMLSEDISMDDVLKRLDHIKINHNIFFFDPKIKNELQSNFKKLYKNGYLYSIENGRISNMTCYKGYTEFEQIVKVFFEETKGSDYIPFILYTNKHSKYIDLMTETLVSYSAQMKKMKEYPIPPGIGIELGEDVMGVGYIIK